MKIAYFTHSVASCWNHGNAHFLRGVLDELIERGHDVVAYEPRDAWSLQNLVRAVRAVRAAWAVRVVAGETFMPPTVGPDRFGVHRSLAPARHSTRLTPSSFVADSVPPLFR